MFSTVVGVAGCTALIVTAVTLNNDVLASYDKQYQEVYGFDTVATVDNQEKGAVQAVYLVLSILMAVVVLLNLNVMFIEEKKRELIVLMINGFSTKDAKRYIYNDTIVLTILGIVVGIALGVVMGSLTVGSVEPTSAFFYKGVDWVAVAAGAGMSALLALVMSVIALRRIPAFNLTDINRF